MVLYIIKEHKLVLEIAENSRHKKYKTSSGHYVAYMKINRNNNSFLRQDMREKSSDNKIITIDGNFIKPGKSNAIVYIFDRSI